MPRVLICLLLIAIGPTAISAQLPRPNSPDTGYTARRQLILMGSAFEVGAFAKTQSTADAAVAAGIAEVERIETLISSWRLNSETTAVINAAGKHPVAISDELNQLLARCAKVSELTDGAFDITAGGLLGLYRFGGQDTVLPSATQLDSALAHVDYRAIVLNAEMQTAFLTRAGMRFGFGAIGKGYAANRARDVMQAMTGVYGGVVNASGDLATFGRNSRDSLWRVGISDPRHADRWLGQLAIRGSGAVVTSGDYQKYFTAGGTRYAHIIDPRTALPTTQVSSATVVCADAEVADALATAVFVLGAEQGVALLNRLHGVEGLVVDAAGKVHISTNLTLEPYQLTR